MNGNGANGKTNQYLAARYLQLAGLILLFGSAIFWAFTQRESILLVSSAMSLILLGKFGRVIDTLKRD